MAAEILNKFVPKDAMQKWQDQGVQFWLAHPDDELLVGWKIIQEFVAAGIPATVVLMTLGEKGKYYGENRDPEELKELRRNEFARSAKMLGFDTKVFGFPDAELDVYEKEMQREAIIYMRETNPAAVFTFSQDDLKLWNHDDHKVTGRVAEKAAEKFNILGIEPDIPFDPAAGRPSLFKFTQHTTEHDIFLPLSHADQMRRVKFAKTIYPSQFGQLEDQVLFDYFQTVSTNIQNTLPHGQRFLKIR